MVSVLNGSVRPPVAVQPCRRKNQNELYLSEKTYASDVNHFSASIIKTGLANAHFYRYTVQRLQRCPALGVAPDSDKCVTDL